ncbi:MAG: hypothetical protein KGL39_36780 [Patescibacteria group bacterium]|nr:hypothetical protein [Patescibacteria group bacterium]
MKSKTESKTVKIASFDELAAKIEKAIPCVFKLDGELIEIPVKRVTPALAERVRKLRRAVLPPYKKERNPAAGGDYDPMDPGYLERKDLNEAKVRALIVYTCCPLVAAKKPGLTDEAEMLAFVQGILSENILDLIMLTAQAGGMNLDEEVQRRANFISTPGSEN